MNQARAHRHAYTYTHTHTRMCTHTRIHTHARAHIHAYAHTHVHVHIQDVLGLVTPFGHLKSCRLPKKYDGHHRGYAFVEFVTKQEARNALEGVSRGKEDSFLFVCVGVCVCLCVKCLNCLEEQGCVCLCVECLNCLEEQESVQASSC